MFEAMINGLVQLISLKTMGMMMFGVIVGVVFGIIPGLGGIAMFIPQIAFLFLFISILEESGYMSRVVFLMDRIMRKVGLNGRAFVPMMSGFACAVLIYLYLRRGMD